jgi:nitrogen fixation/metabolism regulation signal transduction histidine kinase
LAVTGGAGGVLGCVLHRAPTGATAAGTGGWPQAVAAGQFDKQLAQAGSDELGFLVESFNQMTRNLAQARDAAQRSQELLESQRAYLETVLARLSSGVLTIDQMGRLQTCNAGASQILGVDLARFDLGADSQRIIADNRVAGFNRTLIGPHLAQTGDWRQEIRLVQRGPPHPDVSGQLACRTP